MTPTLALAQTPQELASARKLFAEAIQDEERQAFDVALEKFRRVQRVRDTVPVRYRIASCLEGLGNWREATRTYQSAIDLGAGDPKELDVVKAAKERSADLVRRMPRLTLTPSAHAPRPVAVEVDGATVPPDDVGGPMALDPGTHDVAASAPGVAPFKTQISLTEGTQLALVLHLDPADVPKPGVDDGNPGPTVRRDAQPTVPLETPSSSRRTIGWIATGAGVALLGGAAVTWGLREAAISDLNDACPNGNCPASRRDELTSTQSRARFEGPLAAILGGIGVASLGVGIFLLATPTSDSTSTQTARAIRVSGAPLPGGGHMMLTSSF